MKEALQTRDEAQSVMESQNEIASRVKASNSLSAELDAQWKDFQAKFDNLFDLAANALKGNLGGGQRGLRAPELISESVVAQILRRSKRLVVLTGAGISAESGIPTFRGADGYWTVGSENYRPQELATWEKFDEMPLELWRWYQYRWGICREAKPNPGHAALVELEGLVQNGLDLVTQNIDGLHLEAGSSSQRLFEIHGRIDEMRCDERCDGACLHKLDLNDPKNFEKARKTVEKTPLPAKKEAEEKLPLCKACGKRQRPKILWFDECYNEAFFRSNSALEAGKAADVLLIIGTQLTTGLPSRMVSTAREQGTLIVRMDPEADLSEPSNAGMLLSKGKSGELLPRIVKELKSLLLEPLYAPLQDLKLVLTEDSRDSSKPTAAATRRGASKGGRTDSGGGPMKATSSSPSKAQTRLSAAPPLAPSSRSQSRSSTGPTIATAAASASSSSSSSLPRPSPPLSSSLSSSAPVGFFVYGTLRPDDDSGAGWTKSFQEGLQGQAARLFGASLYVGNYPELVLEKTCCSVRGVLLTPSVGQGQAAKAVGAAKAKAKAKAGCKAPLEAAASFESVMTQKLADADQIEGYPDLYDRAVVNVTLSEGGQVVPAYVYHRTGCIDRESKPRIYDGDWMSRIRKS